METEKLEYVFYPSMAGHSLILADKSMLYNANENYLSMESHRVAVYEYAEEEMYRDVTTKEESANEIGNKEAKMLEDISVLQENENLGDPRIKEPGLTTDRMIKIEDVDVNKCTDKIFDNYSSNTEGDSYRNQILRIENLRKIVEDELGEFEKTKKIEHDTNTSIMNIKDIEFPVMINLHQHNEETLAIMESKENLHIIEEENLYIDDINVEKHRKNKDYKYSDISSETIDDEESEFLIISKEDQIQEKESMEQPTTVEEINFGAMKQTSTQDIHMDTIEKHSDDQKDMKLEENITEKTDIDPNISHDNHLKYIEYDDIETNEPDIKAEENTIEASCTLEENMPIVIKSCAFHSSSENVYELVENRTDDEKLKHQNDHTDLVKQEPAISSSQQPIHPRPASVKKTRTANKDIKKRDEQLLHSFMSAGKERRSSKNETDNVFTEKDEQKEEKHEDQSKMAKSNSKTSLASSLGKKVKKETYKIKFKVDIAGVVHSKHSVLHYLFGCFGGQKLFDS